MSLQDIPELYADKVSRLRRSLTPTGVVPPVGSQSLTGLDSGRDEDDNHVGEGSGFTTITDNVTKDGVLALSHPRQATSWWTRKGLSSEPEVHEGAANTIDFADNANDVTLPASTLSLMKSVQTTNSLLDEVTKMEMELRQMRGL